MNRTLLQVVDSGSLSAAAVENNVSVATVARQVNGLEDRLGVKLVNRTTRALSLTEAGAIYCERIRSILQEIDTVKREVSSYQKNVMGLLRVHLRHSVGNQVIVPALPEFLSANPDIRMEVTLTDERADLVALGIDVAVWLGELEDSSLIARRLSPGRRVICCSPAYAEERGIPTSPEELRDHNCIVFRARSYDNVWRLTKDGETASIEVSGNLESFSATALLTSALSGIGLVMVQEATVRRLLAAGDLIPVLPGYQVSSTSADIALYAVYPGRRKTAPKTRVFVDFLVGLFR
ncbi:MAG: LysR family transcriptional regulator [Amaricoccus sp.]